MQITRTNLLAATRKLAERAAAEPLTQTLAAPYPEVHEVRDRLQSWSPESREHLAREKVQGINTSFQITLNRLKGETAEEMLKEASSSQAPRIAETSYKVACWALGLTAAVGLPAVVLGGFDILAGAFNVLAWPAQATGTGFLSSGPGLAFGAIGAGVAVFAAAAGLSEWAEERAKGYADFPARLAQWQSAS